MTLVQDELKILKTKVGHILKFVQFVLSSVISTFILVAAAPAMANVVSGSITQIGDATHLEFKGKTNWNYEVDTKGKSIKLLIPPLDEATENSIRAWTGPLIKKIEIKKDAPDGKYEIHFTLNADDVESFDYLTDEPSRLIVDFYRQTKQKEINSSTVEKSTPSKSLIPNLPEKAVKSKYTKIERSTDSTNNPEYVKKERDLASSELLKVGQAGGNNFGELAPQLSVLQGVYDGGDPEYKRFQIKDYEIKEESIIASQQNIYIKFPMLKLKTSKLDEMLEEPPKYIIHPKDTKENKEARFLLTLHENKRYAAFLKTLEYFVGKYPNSKYDEIIRNLAADVHYQLWLRDGSPADYQKSRSILQYLVNKYPKSVLTERSELIMAYSALEKKDGIKTIQTFLQFLDKYSSSPNRDQARKALSDGYLFLNKHEDALRVLHSLEKTPDEKVSGIEASYRVGDVYFEDEKYKQSIEAYNSAISNFKAQESVFPNANFNIAEAKFWLGDYKGALGNYVRFIELFPAHEHGAYALTRIGEVLDILGADKKRVIGAFLESYYRYRNSEGSEIARIRMLSQKMKSMRSKEMKKALQEMGEIAKGSKLPRMAEFVTLLVADGLHGRKEYNEALNYLISYYQKNPTSADFSFFKKRILKNIGDLIYQEAQDGNFIKVLKINGQYATTWLKNSDRFDIEYFVGRSYEMAGVNSESIDIYKKINKKLSKIKGTREEVERRVNEHLPTIETVNLRIAAASTQMRRYGQANMYLDKIKNDKKLSPKEKVEQVQLLSILAEKQGKLARAKKYLKELIDAWQGKPELLAPVFIRIAGLELATRKYTAAEDSILEVERLKTGGFKVSDNDWYSALLIKGQILEAQNKKVAAVEAYSQLIDQFESTRPVAPIRYKVGQILFDTGNIKGAEKVWSGLDSTKSEMYKGIADERLSNAKWEDEYKKYIDRIPAATELNRSRK